MTRRVLEGIIEESTLRLNAATLVTLPGEGHVAAILTDEQVAQLRQAFVGSGAARVRVRGNASCWPNGVVDSIIVEKLAVCTKVPDPEAPCEDLFARLASSDPDRLLRFLDPASDLADHLLTYAAEIAGTELPAARVVPALLRLLSHPSAVVREGAIYGLDHHLGEPDVPRAVIGLADTDPSAGVRAAASGAADSLEKAVASSVIEDVRRERQAREAIEGLGVMRSLSILASMCPADEGEANSRTQGLTACGESRMLRTLWHMCDAALQRLDWKRALERERDAKESRHGD